MALITHVWQNKKYRYGSIFAVLVLITVVVLLSGSDDEEVVATDEPRAVRVAAVAALQADSARTYVGTVTAVNQARLQTQAGGRIVSVPVSVGNRVAAGAVIAQLENASERAAVTQAEGAYEAALAGSQQSDSGVRDTETALASARENAAVAVRNAYNAANASLINTIDVFFSQPQGSVPGLRISGDARTLNAERVAYQALMPSWQQNVNQISPQNISTRLTEAEANVERTISFVDRFITATNNAAANEEMLGQPVRSYTAGLLAESDRLKGTLRNIQTARTSLTTAEEAVVRANLGGTDSTVSVANAQIKQALGSLQAAQAALARTVVRSPIDGTVNALQVNVGDFVGMGTAVAEIVNESAYEISIFVSDLERTTIALGDTVQINNTLTGTVTNIAPALDPRTQKIEVRIAVEGTGLLSGATAVVSFPSTATLTENQPLSVPLTAVAFAIDGGALLVANNNTVAALPITLGEIRGSRVTINGEIASTTEIIVDARGLVVGQAINLIRE